MTIIKKHSVPLAYLKALCAINEKAWDYAFGHTRISYWARIVLGLTDAISRRHNALYLAVENGVCAGYLMARIAGRPVLARPLLRAINAAAHLVLARSKRGREELASKALYDDQLDKMVRLGKYVLAGKNHRKVSEGIMVAVRPEYRKAGLYRELTMRLMEDIQGYFIFQSSTESVYKAHQAMGYRTIFELPLFYPEKHRAFIMYGEPALIAGGPRPGNFSGGV